MTRKQEQQSEDSFLQFWTKGNKLYSGDVLLSLRHIQEHQQWQEEGQEEEKRPVGCRHRGDGTLPLGPVAERGVAAGDAD